MSGQLKVIGLDLSLSSTGVAQYTSGLLGGDPETYLITSRKSGIARIDSQATRIGQAILAFDPDLAVVEGPSLHSAGGSAYWHENAGLWHMIIRGLWRKGRPFAVVPPAVLKKWATGKGNADKIKMVTAAITRFGLREITADEADALWLAAAGLQHYGMPGVKMPAENVAALENVKNGQPVVRWPASLDRPRPEPVPVLSTGPCTYPHTGGHTWGRSRCPGRCPATTTTASRRTPRISCRTR